MKVSVLVREEELFWVAWPDYARAPIRDCMETPKRHRVQFSMVNGLAPWIGANRAGAQVSDTSGLTLPASSLRPFVVASV
jgi:hypothetical protein